MGEELTHAWRLSAPQKPAKRPWRHSSVFSLLSGLGGSVAEVIVVVVVTCTLSSPMVETFKQLSGESSRGQCCVMWLKRPASDLQNVLQSAFLIVRL